MKQLKKVAKNRNINKIFLNNLKKIMYIYYRMFNCELCHYTTDRSSNLKKHFKTKKHVLNVNSESKNNNNMINDYGCNHASAKTHRQIENTKKNTQKNILKNVKNSNRDNVCDYGEIVYDYAVTNLIENVVCNKNKNMTNENLVFNKHNDNKIYKCEHCDNIYKCRQNLWRHKQRSICGSVIKNKNGEVNEIKKQMEQMTKKLEVNNKLIETLLTNKPTGNVFNNQTTLNTNSHNNNSINTNIENNQKTIVFNYVNNNYQNAQPIKMLEIDHVAKLLEMKNTSYSLFDFIIYYYKKYDLHGFLGKIIVDEYKKTDPEEQQIWISSVLRLTFIVRQVLNKENVWLKDMNGVCITQNIINPILQEVKKILQTHITTLKDPEKMKKKDIEEYVKAQEDGMVALEIIQKINENELHQLILKYVAPYFQLYSDIKLMENKKPTKKKQLLIKNK